MYSANLDEIKKKYNFKDISVATWRNPALSVLPARGGPDSPGLSPDTAYVPTYKVNYDLLSQGPDDEDNSGPDREEEQSELEVPPDLNLDEPFEDQPIEDEDFDDSAIESRSDEGDCQTLHDTNADHSRPNHQQEHESTPNSIAAEGAMAGEEDKPMSAGTELPEGEADALVNDTQLDGSGASETMSPELGEEAAAGARTPSEAGSDERRVSFAPGTPDPKPTTRKKKAAKGTKTKKKRIAVPLDSLPADVMAMLDTAFEEAPPPPPRAPDPPLECEVETGDASEDPTHTDEPASNNVGDIEEPAKEESSSEVVPDVEPLDIEVASEPTHEPPAETTDENLLDGQKEERVLDSIPAPEATTVDPPAVESAPDIIQEAPAPNEKSSKKKSSKSGKDKDKSKKKPSKNKTRDVSPQPAGLGSDLPPPLSLETTVQVEEESPPAGKTTDDALISDATNQEIPTDLGNGNEALVPAGDAPAEAASSQGAETNDPVPSASDMAAPEELNMGEDDKGDTDVVADESAHTDEINEPGEGSEPAAENENADVKALDPSLESVKLESVKLESVNQLESGLTTEDQVLESKIAPMESASSPADSGVDLDDDGQKGIETASDGLPLDEQPATEVHASEPSHDPENSSHVGDDHSGSQDIAAPVEDAPSEPAKAHDPQAQSSEEKVEEPSTQNDGFQDGPTVQDDAVVEDPSKDSRDVPDSSVVSNADAPGAESTSREIAIEDAAIEKAPDDETNLASQSEASLVAGESESGNADGENDNAVDDSKPAEASPATEEEVKHEPPLVESALDEPKPEPPESTEGAAVLDEIPSGAAPKESPKEVEPAPEPPVSPNSSKSSSKSSHKHRADRLARKHIENPAKSALQDRKVLERPHSRGTNGKEGLRVKDRSPKSRRRSLSGEDEEERQRRRAARRREEDARRAEEERRRAEDEERRRARRAARTAVTEQAVKREAEAAVKKGELVHRRHRERESDRDEVRANREIKRPAFTLPSISKALNLTSGESVHGTTLVRAHGSSHRTIREVSKASAPKHKDEPEPKEAPKETQKEPPREAKQKSPPSSNGEKSHHKHRHHRHRSDGERSSRHHEHRTRRPSVEERVEERPRSFLGGLVRI